MTKNRILNQPKSEYRYEFTVVIPRADGNFDFHSYHEYADTAYNTAKEVNGIVAHDVRVCHKELIKKS